MKSNLTKSKKQLLELALIWAKLKKANRSWMNYCITCMVCKHWTQMCWWHFIPQAKWDSTKFELDNINCQCSTCNGKANQWEQYKHWLFIDKEYYKWRAEELHTQSRTLKKWKAHEIEDQIKIVWLCIIERYDHQTPDQQKLLVKYISKNSTRKAQCRDILGAMQ